MRSNQSGDKSESDRESQESIADSNLESANGVCLSCSDTEEAAVRYAHQKFCKKVWTSCRLTRWSLWKVSQMALIDNNCQAVWGSDFSIVKEEQDLALKEDFGSFQMDMMAIQTD